MKVTANFVFIFLLALVLVYFISTSKKETVFQQEVQTEKKSGLRLDKISLLDPAMLRRMDVLISMEVEADNKELVELARQMMDPPSYSFTLKLSRAVYKTPQAQAVDEYLNGRKNGFFIEAGANDGERSSNTLFFEKDRGWKGLLIEADPFFYAQLLGKNRRSWSINACLSPFNKPSRLSFMGHAEGQGKVKLGKPVEKISMTSTSDLVVPCFPLRTLLLAIDISHVDFFSLDVEGVEMPILETIDFSQIDIETLAVEYAHGNKSSYETFMVGKGYRVEKTLDVANQLAWVKDFIFVKNKI